LHSNLLLKLVIKVVLTIGLLSQSASIADDAQGSTLKIGITSRTAPYIYEDDVTLGIDPEVLSLLLNRMGYSVEFIKVPYVRRIIVMNSNKLDAITLWSLPEDGTCFTTKPYRYWRNAFFETQKPEPRRTQIGIFSGSEGLSTELSKIGLSHPDLKELPTINGAVRMLLYGRIDGYIGDYPTVIYNLKKEDPKQVLQFEISHFFTPKPQRLCFADARHAIAFDKVITEVEEDGKALRVITQKHGFAERITPPLN
jgi:ABC-type amino acid transport substrate-binding protein